MGLLKPKGAQTAGKEAMAIVAQDKEKTGESADHKGKSAHVHVLSHMTRRLHVRGIRNRWLRNSFLAVAAIMLTVVITLSIGVSGYYYSAMRSGLMNKAKMASDFFANYASTETEYKRMASTYIMEFNEKNSLELQFLTVDTQPSVYLSSSGLTAGSKPQTPDIASAIRNETISVWSGRNPDTGERILATSAPILINGEVKGVLRMVTSLKQMDHQVFFLFCIFVLAGMLVMILTYMVNMYFVRSIIEPMAALTETAKRIASGYYGFQI
jgi:hypothetical protein